MIFIILGSQKFQFNRLLKAIDELIEKGILKDEIFAQSGYSDYKPKNYRYIDFLDRNEFMKYEENADIIITHGGTGSIIGALKKRKKVIAIPRLKKYGEHVDDHQIQLITAFTNQNLICGIDSCKDIEAALEYVKNHDFDVYVSNTEKIINSIENFIKETQI